MAQKSILLVNFLLCLISATGEELDFGIDIGFTKANIEISNTYLIGNPVNMSMIRT